MATPTKTTARTDERPVEKLAQWRLIKENPLLDSSSETWSEESETSDSMVTSASSWAWTVGVSPSVACPCYLMYCLTRRCLYTSSMMLCPYAMKGAIVAYTMEKLMNEVNVKCLIQKNALEQMEHDLANAKSNEE